MVAQYIGFKSEVGTNMETEVRTDTQGADIVSEFQAGVREWGWVDNEDKVRVDIWT